MLAVRKSWKSSAAPITSTWACFVEAMYLVGRIGGHRLQNHLWALLGRGIIRSHEHGSNETSGMATLMNQYQNVPMDLADASLVIAAEAIGDRPSLRWTAISGCTGFQTEAHLISCRNNHSCPDAATPPIPRLRHHRHVLVNRPNNPLLQNLSPRY